MGGEWYNHQGGGVYYLCLPHNPKYDRYNDGNQASGYLYGVEYEVGSYSGYPFRRNLHDHEAPCVVCFVKSRGSMLMMPARNDCPTGWTEEYWVPDDLIFQRPEPKRLRLRWQRPRVCSRDQCQQGWCLTVFRRRALWLTSVPSICSASRADMCCLHQVIKHSPVNLTESVCNHGWKINLKKKMKTDLESVCITTVKLSWSVVFQDACQRYHFNIPCHGFRRRLGQ